jgi:hypothetical protein
LVVETINKYRGTKVIFSDDKQYQSQLRVLASSPFGVGEIDSGLSGIDNYFCQFLALSKCKQILGTMGSSFPEQAAIFGGIEYIPI